MRQIVTRCGLLAAFVLPALWFHLHLSKAAPGPEAVVASPSEVRLWFSQAPELKLTTITLLGADQEKIGLGPVTKTDDPTSVSAKVMQPLGPGGYVVMWRTASKDGHPVRGRYAFTVAKGAAPAAPAAAAEPAGHDHEAGHDHGAGHDDDHDHDGRR